MILKITIIAPRHANSGCGRFRGLQSRDWNKKISDQVCLWRRNQRRYNELAAPAVPHSSMRDALDDVTILSLRRSQILPGAMRQRHPLYVVAGVRQQDPGWTSRKEFLTGISMNVMQKTYHREEVGLASYPARSSTEASPLFLGTPPFFPQIGDKYNSYITVI